MIASLCLRMTELGASDLFLSAGRIPAMRRAGNVTEVPGARILTEEDCQEFFQRHLPPATQERLRQQLDLDLGVNLGDGTRFRLASVWPRVGRHGELFWGVISDEKAGKSRLVDVTFPKKGYLYDLASGKGLGFGNRFRLSLSKGNPFAFELLDAEPKMDVAASGVEVTVTYTPSVDTVVQVKVFDPSGAEAWYYSRKVVVKDGAAKMTIPFAKSDAQGAWRIEATDVLTGARGTVSPVR